MNHETAFDKHKKHQHETITQDKDKKITKGINTLDYDYDYDN